MSDVDPANLIHTRIWQEEAEPDNPFATRAAYCRGYDVFGEMVGNARWVEMLYLLFKDNLPEPAALDMLEALAVALANPGPREASVHAAMCGAVGGSTAAASLIAALSVAAGRNGGAREVFDSMNLWTQCGTDLELWSVHAADKDSDKGSDISEVWLSSDHVPGFDPYGVSTSTSVKQLLNALAGMGKSPCISWLNHHREELEALIGLPLALSGIAAVAFVDLGFSSEEGEILYLFLRLPGAAAHVVEQRRHGHKKFPFFSITVETDSAKEIA